MRLNSLPHFASLFPRAQLRTRRHLFADTHRTSRHFFEVGPNRNSHLEAGANAQNSQQRHSEGRTPKSSVQNQPVKQRGRAGARCLLKCLSLRSMNRLSNDKHTPHEKQDVRRVSNLQVATSAFTIRNATMGPESLRRLAEPRVVPFIGAPRRELSPATPELPTSRPDSYLTDLAAPVRGSQPHSLARDVGATHHSHAGGVTVDDRLVVMSHFSFTSLASILRL